MNERFTRFNRLLTDQEIHNLETARVAIVGLGGVGGTALECLVRSGVQHLLIIDHDVVNLSNLNRQILYATGDNNQKKVACAARRMLEINPDLDLTSSDRFIDQEQTDLLTNWNPTHLVDAIDFIPGKVALIQYARTHGIPIISSLGMGNRLCPSQVVRTTLDQTTNDPLAKALRSRLRKEKIELNTIEVIASKESPQHHGTHIGSSMAVTSSAGLLLAQTILAKIIKR